MLPNEKANTDISTSVIITSDNTVSTASCVEISINNHILSNIFIRQLTRPVKNIELSTVSTAS
ncbi:MAG: hypothetical protein RR909_03175 [Bacilli bacterium]